MAIWKSTSGTLPPAPATARVCALAVCADSVVIGAFWGLVHGPSSSSASPLPYIVSPGSSAFPLRLKPRDGVRVPLGDRSVLGLFPVTPKLWGASICSEQERPQLCVWPAPSHTNSSALAEATAGLTLCNSTSCWGWRGGFWGGSGGVVYCSCG